MSSGIVSVDALRSLAFGSIGATYLPIGTPFAHPMRVVKIINTSNTDMFVSFDGTTDNDYVPAGSFVLYDLCTNQENNGEGWFFRNSTQVYVRYAVAPASGSVFVIALYGKGE